MSRARSLALVLLWAVAGALAGAVLAPRSASADGWVRYEHDAANVALTGSAISANDGSDSAANSVRWAAAGGGTVTCSNSTGMRVVTRKNLNLGIVNIYLNNAGSPTTSVDQYNAAIQGQQVIYEVTGLSVGTHTVRLGWTGTKHALSQQSWAHLDAFECYQITPTTTTTAPPTTTTTTAPPTTTTVPPTTTTLCDFTEQAPCVVALGSYEGTVGVMAIGGFVAGGVACWLCLYGIRHLRGV